jgi:ferredoxin-NADP reductase
MANPVKIPAAITSVKEHDQGVYTLSITPEKRTPRFKPGQFLHLTIDDYDPQGGFWPESRVFSIASAPGSEILEIIYSVKGRYTSRMGREIIPGKRVWLKLPYGEFSIESAAAPGQDIVLVAGGTGISPFISYLQGIAKETCSRAIRLIYGIRKPEHLLYPEVLRKVGVLDNRIGIDLFIEAGKSPLPEQVRQFAGMITLDHIINQGKTMVNPAYFLSGPPGMIKNFKRGLLEANIKPENIKIDEWE